MRLSSKGQIAISGMMFLAIHGKGRAMTAAQIAEDQEISVSYIEQLFANLRESDLIEGVRGPGGGYRLALSAEAKNPLLYSWCPHGYSHCDHGVHCC